MKTINLSMENLIKTEWFDQFDPSQKSQIKMGLENGVDVSIYAKPEFTSIKMEQIRQGLEQNLDVSWYAKPEFTSEQMKEIRRGLRKKLMSLFTPKLNLIGQKW